MEQDQPYLSTKDLAERYGITQRTIKKWQQVQGEVKQKVQSGIQYHDRQLLWVLPLSDTRFHKYLLGKKQTQFFLLNLFNYGLRKPFYRASCPL